MSSTCFPCIECIPHGFADEHQKRQQDSQDGECGKTQPGGLQILFALVE